MTGEMPAPLVDEEDTARLPEVDLPVIGATPVRAE